uniref:asparagine synthase (glutamine-hydrolyzing) n=1 Tax=Desulfomonile tiedjei TaxID=2358 RepID=A0A7C4EXX6_9BACT
MCGICGIVDFETAPLRSSVEAMNCALAHRGPDMGGIEEFQACVLGHRRLSILDLSEAARQPMVLSERGIALVFNGEIYNFQTLRTWLQKKGYVFKTNSDSEVLLALYAEKQEGMLEDLNGMFSFAIWDDERKRLFLARDRLGKKPLYYYSSHGRLSFSSELYSLGQDPSAPQGISEQALFQYFLYDFIPAPQTIFSGVAKLPAGHRAFFDRDGLRIERYWTPPLPDAPQEYSQACEALQELLENSVKLRLISDVPLGAFLSGGIDSTLISALVARQATHRVKTFSIGFPGTSHDESKWSQMAAKYLRTDHREFSSSLDVEFIFPRMIRHFGEPFGDSSALPTWHLARQTRQEVTVALSGDGGDELFGGYDRYLARRLQSCYEVLPKALRGRFIEPLIEKLPETTDYYGTSTIKKLKLFLRACARLQEEPLALVPRTFSQDQASRLTGVAYRPDEDACLSIARQYIGLEPVTAMMLTDIQTYLAEDILTKVDRMAMAHSLEVRCPLLDYRVVELACRMPLSFKLKRGRTKRILRDAAKPYVPPSILTRPKYGFQIPLGEWLKGKLRPWAQSMLFDASHQLLDREFIAALWDEHQHGRCDHAHRLWLILIFQEWYNQYRG